MKKLPILLLIIGLLASCDFFMSPSNPGSTSDTNPSDIVPSDSIPSDSIENYPCLQSIDNSILMGWEEGAVYTLSEDSVASYYIVYKTDSVGTSTICIAKFGEENANKSIIINYKNDSLNYVFHNQKFYCIEKTNGTSKMLEFDNLWNKISETVIESQVESSATQSPLRAPIAPPCRSVVDFVNNLSKIGGYANDNSSLKI